VTVTKPKIRAAANLGGILRVCRDLMEPIRSVVLSGSGLSWDKAELLLELWRVAKGIGDFSADADGYVTFKELRESLANSQPHVSRRIGEVAPREKDPDNVLVDVRKSKSGGAHHANSHRVRISKKGFARIEPVWESLRRLAAALFDGIRQPDQVVHFQVNQRILHKIRPYRFDAFLKTPPDDPVENIITALKVRRELITPRVKERLLEGTDLTLEKADILVDLYGAKELNWSDPKANKEGFVAFKQLQASLVHGESSSQVLLSRRARELEGQSRIEVKKAKRDQKYLGENDGFRITEKGILVVEPIWKRYNELAEDLMQEVSPNMRLVHSQVNEALLLKLQPAWVRLL
jgi:hypothetical protein